MHTVHRELGRMNSTLSLGAYLGHIGLVAGGLVAPGNSRTRVLAYMHNKSTSPRPTFPNYRMFDNSLSSYSTDHLTKSKV